MHQKRAFVRMAFVVVALPVQQRSRPVNNPATSTTLIQQCPEMLASLWSRGQSDVNPFRSLTDLS